MPKTKHPDLRTWTNHEGVEFTAKKILEDGGRAWYTFTEPLKMPAARCLAGELAVEWANLNLTPDDLRAYIAKMKEDGNAGQIVDMFTTLGIMEERLNWHCEQKTLQALACVYFILDDEPLGECSDAHDAEKLRLWGRSDEVAAFFLTQAFVLTRGFTPFSGTGILDYLRAIQLQHLRKPKSRTASAAPAPDSSTSRQSFMAGVKNLTRRSHSRVEKPPRKSTD